MKHFAALFCLILLLPVRVALAVTPSEVRVVGLFPNAAVLNIQGKQRLLKAGQTSPEGVKLIRADSRNAYLEIDGQEHRLSLSRAIEQYTPPEQVSTSIAINHIGQYFANGSINGQPVQLLVDTGATSVAMNTAQARRLGINFAAGREGQASTAGGLVRSYSVTLDSVKVGEIEIKNVRAAVLEGAFPTHVLLGMTYLGHVEINENNGVMKLTKKY